MLKSTLLAATAVLKVDGSTPLQSLTYIPDDNFESALIQFGYDDELDNYVETDKISQVQSLKLNDRQIRDATGIEAFVSLIDLSITNNLFSNKKIEPKEIDVFTATCGPGLIGSLLVGSTFTKSLAISFNKPFIPTNHLEGHILSTSFNNNIKFPNLILLLTGGHTQVYLMKSENEICLLYTSPSPRDRTRSRMPSSA